MKNLSNNFISIVFILLAVSVLFSLFAEPFKKVEKVTLSKLVQDINEGAVQKITVSGNTLTVLYQEDGEKQSRKEPEASLSESLVSYGVEKDKLAKLDIEAKEETGVMSWLGPLSFVIFPLLFFVFFFFLMFRQARAGLGQAFDFTKAKARLFGAEGHPKQTVTFKDVAGLKEAKEERSEER